MKRRKILLSVTTILLTAVSVAALFAGCSNGDKRIPQGKPTPGISEADGGEGTTAPSGKAAVNEDGSVRNSDLAKSCKKILGTGLDKNGTIYEVVANVNETYQGSTLLVGVIKNSKWLIEPTANCPLIHSKSWYGWEKDGKDLERLSCTYLSNGAFINTKINTMLGYDTHNSLQGDYPEMELWNVENGKHTVLEDVSPGHTDYYCLADTPSRYYGHDKYLFGYEISYWDKSLKVLDTKTLEVKELFRLDFFRNYCSWNFTQISEGCSIWIMIL